MENTIVDRRWTFVILIVATIIQIMFLHYLAPGRVGLCGGATFSAIAGVLALVVVGIISVVVFSVVVTIVGGGGFIVVDVVALVVVAGADVVVVRGGGGGGGLGGGGCDATTFDCWPPA